MCQAAPARVQVSHNVAYDNLGHTFFIEDAVESGNR